MAQSLYRTYRPQTFDEVIGQEHITDLLKNAISKNKITHSYLFTGPRGLGKTSVARIFAKALNCENISKDGNPCNECNNCKSITNGTYFDLLEIDAASNRGIDQIRELKEKIAYQPTQGKFKVYIIDEVHMLTTEAFNALLKTLEEPPSHAIFVLATTESYKLPATIVSRCQKYDFRLGSHEKLRDCLISVLKNEGRKMDEEAIQIIIEQSTGSYRDLLSLSDVVLSGIADLDIEVSEVDVRQSLGLPDHTMVYYFLENLVKGDYKKSFNMLDEVYQKGVSIQQFIYSVIDILKQILIDKTVKGRRKKSTITADFSFLEKLSDVTLFKLLKKFLDVTQSIKDSPIPTLPIEVLILESQELFDMEREEKEDEKKNSKIEEIEVDKETEKDIYKKSQKKEGKLESKKSLKKMPKKETGDSTKSISIENLTKKMGQSNFQY